MSISICGNFELKRSHYNKKEKPESESVVREIRLKRFNNPPLNQHKPYIKLLSRKLMLNKTILYDAHRQWANRSPDERFAGLEDLYNFTKNIKDSSQEEVKPLEYIALNVTPEGSIALNGNLPYAHLSHWAFGQLCRNLGAPARYLRTLPPDMVRDCLQYGLRKSETECKILTRDNISQIAKRIASAFTSPSYGRIWDSDLEL